MSPTRRKALKRKLAQAHHHLDLTLETLLEVKAVFDPTHPEYAEALDFIAQQVLLTQQMILAWWEKTWGSLPKNVNSYRG